MSGMEKVTSFIRCESNGMGGQYLDRDGDPREIIDMAIKTAKAELWDNLQLMRYAKCQTRRMFRELWRASDAHDKMVYALEVCGRYALGCLACLGGIVLVGWCVTALERLVFG